MQHHRSHRKYNFILKNNGSKRFVQLNGAFAKMKRIKRDRCSNKFRGFGNGESYRTGVFDGVTEVDGVIMNGRCFIVKNCALKIDLIMGQDFICQTEIIVNKDGVKFRNVNTELAKQVREDHVAECVEFLDHNVENSFIKPSIEKTKVVKNFLQPENLRHRYLYNTVLRVLMN